MARVDCTRNRRLCSMAREAGFESDLELRVGEAMGDPGVRATGRRPELSADFR